MDQHGFDVRFEWGVSGLEALRGARTFIVVDVLSFSTCVAAALERGAIVIPCPLDEQAAKELAARHDALLAGRRGSTYSLSPQSMSTLDRGARIVLPSLNGAALSCRAAAMGCVLAGCLRNRSAVATRAIARGGPVAVLAAGERWPDGSLRPAIEDLVGAGAIASALPGTRSPEAEIAIAAFEAAARAMTSTLHECSSGRELVERGYANDVTYAAELDVCTIAPELVDGAFAGSAAT
jgi:2-phosphosulfolactate phosphatase